jgi:Zn-dependent protease with chaperone function
MLCPNCGKELSAGATFCPFCGTKVADIFKRPLMSTSVAYKISTLRHPKEQLYFTLGAIFGGITWLGLIWLVFLFFWVAIPAVIVLWIVNQFFKAKLLGNAVMVSREQYPEIFEIVEKQSRLLNLKKIPYVFIVNSQGVINALAIRYLKDKYVILFSELVDLMLASSSMKELSAIIGHELGHHAAGHTVWWKHLLLMPASVLPFFRAAYSRACELTADRIGMWLCGDKDAACRALIALACGSKFLSFKTNINAFKEQESLLPSLFAFIHDLYSSHPRITKRVLALEEAVHLLEGKKEIEAEKSFA